MNYTEFLTKQTNEELFEKSNLLQLFNVSDSVLEDVESNEKLLIFILEFAKVSDKINIADENFSFTEEEFSKWLVGFQTSVTLEELRRIGKLEPETGYQNKQDGEVIWMKTKQDPSLN